MIDLLTQVVNIDIDNIGEGLKIIAPDRIDNLRAREHLTRMVHQVLQEGKLFGCQLDDATGTARLVSYQVECQVTGRELRDLVKTAIAPTQQRVDASQLLLHRKGLDQVVICPYIETDDTVLDGTTCREHQYRRHDTLSAHLAPDLPSIESSHLHIEDHALKRAAQAQLIPGLPA